MEKFLHFLSLIRRLFFCKFLQKKIMLLFILFLFQLLSASQPTRQSIDKRLNELKDANFKQTITTNTAISIADQCYKDSKLIKYSYGIRLSGLSLAFLYYSKGDFEKSIKISDEIENLVEKSSDNYIIATEFYKNRALNYTILGLSGESYREYQKALKMAEKIPDNDERYYRISAIYVDLSYYYAQSPQPSEEKFIDYYLLKGLKVGELISKDGKLAETGARNEWIIMLNYFLGTNYMTAREPDMILARKYFMHAQEIYETSDTKMIAENEVRFLSFLCRFYYTDKNFEKAIEFGQKALKASQKASSPGDRKNIYEFLSKSYLELGKKKESQEYMDAYFRLSDSINRSIKVRADQSAEKIISKKEKDGTKKINLIIYIASGTIILLVTITFLVWKRNSKKLHRSYQKVIDHLKTEKNEDMAEEKIPEKKSEKESYSLNISNETQQQILSKLSTFERSLEFLQKDITLTLLAHQLNTNPKYLSEIIKINKNKTFSSYINGLKINYITKKLFKSSLYREYKISYLAEECGYSSSQVFVIAFKKETGVTPSYFIKNLKKDSTQISANNK